MLTEMFWKCVFQFITPRNEVLISNFELKSFYSIVKIRFSVSSWVQGYLGSLNPRFYTYQWLIFQAHLRKTNLNGLHRKQRRQQITQFNRGLDCGIALIYNTTSIGSKMGSWGLPNFTALNFCHEMFSFCTCLRPLKENAVNDMII